jgi:hypothetical protein
METGHGALFARARAIPSPALQVARTLGIHAAAGAETRTRERMAQTSGIATIVNVGCGLVPG